MCGPTLYNVDEERGEANPVMIPVSSTAIPLDDLPVFKVILFTMFLSGTVFIFCLYIYMNFYNLILLIANRLGLALVHLEKANQSTRSRNHPT